ncbi:hypothetical protein [Marinomonas algicola]|uniref:hypothetical protein n=1 Tax=Marinomonas algicola TaxID=2773454 RepID=UPI00174DA72E|nr:hypothetical protein [Marinomonas algicola]
MPVEKESLEQRFKKRLRVFFTLGFIILSCLVMAWDFTQFKQNSLNQLKSKHDLVERAFFTYLQKAEFEISGIAQLFASSGLPSGREMKSLFSSHDTFLLGVIDFIHIEREDGFSIEDPRSQLYLDGSASVYDMFSKIGKWQVFTTGVSDYFLVFKKEIVSLQGRNLGYIYGFISLNNNFVFAHSLLKSASVDGVSLLTNQGGGIFDVKTPKAPVDEWMRMYKEEISLSGTPSKIELGVLLQQTELFSFEDEVPYKMLLLALILLSGYLTIVKLARSAIFTPMLYSMNDLMLTQNAAYKEFDEIEKIINGRSASEKEQLGALQLLMEGSSTVVIFCDEVASVLRMNQDAKVLFSDAENARTLFDFMPITSHSSIQKALKGEAGTTFTLSFSHVNKTYHWTIYAYIAESGFRGLALIGKDITKETQLEWQLSQIQPAAFLIGQQVGSEELLLELSYLAGRCDSSNSFPIGEWLNALVFCLKGLSDLKDENSARSSLGKVLCSELDRVPITFYSRGDIVIDCDMEAASVMYFWPGEFKALLSSLVMMIHSNELVEEKSISFKVSHQKLTIDVLGVSHSRPVFSKLVERLVEKVGAKLEVGNDKHLSISLPYVFTETELIELPSNFSVVWIENGYERSALVMFALHRLAVNVTCVRSVDDFFLQSNTLEKIDAILVGCADYSYPDYNELAETMSMMLDRKDLPIAMVGCNKVDNGSDFILDYYPFSYSVAELLISLCQLRPVIPEDLRLNGRNWLLVGGTKVTKAIVKSELVDHDIVPHFVDEMESYTSLLHNYDIEVIVALDTKVSSKLATMKMEFPTVRILLTQPIDAEIDAEIFLIRLPHDASRIKEMIEFVSSKNDIKN